MNKYLVDFFDDELKTNDYYETIRLFQKDKELSDQRVLSDIVNEYDDCMDNFGPYKFVDGIEDFLRENYDRCLEECEDIHDVINLAFFEDFMSNY